MLQQQMRFASCECDVRRLLSMSCHVFGVAAGIIFQPANQRQHLSYSRPCSWYCERPETLFSRLNATCCCVPIKCKRMSDTHEMHRQRACCIHQVLQRLRAAFSDSAVLGAMPRKSQCDCCTPSVTVGVGKRGAASPPASASYIRCIFNTSWFALRTRHRIISLPRRTCAFGERG